VARLVLPLRCHASVVTASSAWPMPAVRSTAGWKATATDASIRSYRCGRQHRHPIQRPDLSGARRGNRAQPVSDMCALGSEGAWAPICDAQIYRATVR